MLLKYYGTDVGNCRVLYKYNSSLFCWQEEAKGHFVFYSCTEDEEPITAINLKPEVRFEYPEESCMSKDLIAQLKEDGRLYD